MIDLCHEYCSKFCLDFNSKKSKIMIFGRSYNKNIVPLQLSGEPIEFVTEWKYLGITLVTGKHLSYSAGSDLTSFFRATNAVINVLVLMSILYLHFCTPTVFRFSPMLVQLSIIPHLTCLIAILQWTTPSEKSLALLSSKVLEYFVKSSVLNLCTRLLKLPKTALWTPVKRIKTLSFPTLLPEIVTSV